MTLGFKQYFPWHTEKNPAPTYFREKILGGQRIPCSINGGTYAASDKVSEVKIFTPKLHTLREDPHDRWKAGRKIEMVYRGAGYKIIDHFNKGIPELEKCVSVQKIEIKFKLNGSAMVVYVDGKPTSIEQLSRNDGFNTVEDFFRWFNTDWSGKIIHWSNFRY